MKKFTRLLRSNTLGSASRKTVEGSKNQNLQGCFAAKHLEALRAKQLRVPSLYIISHFAHTTNMNVQVNYTKVC